MYGLIIMYNQSAAGSV